jgi:hypothetical protein
MLQTISDVPTKSALIFPLIGIPANTTGWM